MNKYKIRHDSVEYTHIFTIYSDACIVKFLKNLTYNCPTLEITDYEGNIILNTDIQICAELNEIECLKNEWLN